MGQTDRRTDGSQPCLMPYRRTRPKQDQIAGNSRVAVELSTAEVNRYRNMIIGSILPVLGAAGQWLSLTGNV